MADKAFAAYQESRRAKENSVRAAIINWAFTEGPGKLTVAQLKSLSDAMAHTVNQAMREAYEIGAYGNAK